MDGYIEDYAVAWVSSADTRSDKYLERNWPLPVPFCVTANFRISQSGDCFGAGGI